MKPPRISFSAVHVVIVAALLAAAAYELRCTAALLAHIAVPGQ